jgi:hypothetical protein
MVGDNLEDFFVQYPVGFFKVYPQVAYEVAGLESTHFNIDETVIIPWRYEKRMPSFTDALIFLFEGDTTLTIRGNQKVLSTTFEGRVLNINEFTYINE